MQHSRFATFKWVKQEIELVKQVTRRPRKTVVVMNLERDLKSELQKLDRLSAWHDRKLLPGQDWDGEIKHELNQADVVLFLVSPAFLNSHYCQEIEGHRAVERCNAGEAVLVPIIIHRCEFQNESFARFQAYPLDGSLRDCEISRGQQQRSSNVDDRSDRRLDCV